MLYVTYFLVFAALIVLFIILYKIFKFLVSFVVIAVLVLVAYLTNPSEEKHREMVRQKATLGHVSMLTKKVSRENFYLVSLTRVSELGDDRIVGAGAFTQVYIFGNP